MKKMTAMITSLLLIMTGIMGCGQISQEEVTNTTVSTTQVSENEAKEENSVETTMGVMKTDDMFTSRDKNPEYDENEVVKIQLNGNTARVENGSVDINDTIVTISQEGSYLFTGSLDHGQIVIDCDKKDKVQLILDGVELTNDTSAAIYIKSADKVFITLADESNNKLSTTSEFVSVDDNNIDSVIFSKDDLTLNGSGALEINTEYGNGIVSKDDLVITNGAYTINSQKHGLQGKDSVRIADGNFVITSGKDGIHAKNDDDEMLGYIYIENGIFQIESTCDAIDADYDLTIVGGEFEIVTGGGSENASFTKDGKENPKWGNWEKESGSDVSTETTSSAKGIKSSGNIVVQNGIFQIDSSDDAIHSDANVQIYGGEFDISSGDDGIHADAITEIHDGIIEIKKSYEGIEGNQVLIHGGDIAVVAQDDGINAAGGNDQSSFGRQGADEFTSNSDSCIQVTGGIIYVNAGGDGIDANGDLIVSGGEIYVSGPSDNGNGALDYDNNAQIAGGIIVAAGMSGMAQNFGSFSTQGSMLVNFGKTLESGISVVLKDSSGNEILSYAPENAYNSVVISCPEVVEGEAYQITAGDESVAVEMVSVIYGEGSGDMPGRGGAPGEKNKSERREKPGDRPMQDDVDGQMPDMPDGGVEPPPDSRVVL